MGSDGRCNIQGCSKCQIRFPSDGLGQAGYAADKWIGKILSSVGEGARIILGGTAAKPVRPNRDRAGIEPGRPSNS
jgi:hypothetical protein